MIKFFRKIRQNLLSEGQTEKYLKYALGEILLVVIGILIALQVNDWNEVRKNNNKANSFLLELKKNIESDIDYLLNEDSIHAVFESNSEKALLRFYEAKDFRDLLIVDSLFTFQWSDLEISRSVYDEMLNSGSIYSLQNDKLKETIAKYYTLVESRKYAIQKINDMSIRLSENSGLYRLQLMQSSNGVLTSKLDDAWIGDPNSSIYMGLYRFYFSTNMNCNTYRRRFGEQMLKESKELLKELNNELNLTE